MRMRTSKIAFGWFLFGLGSQLQLWGTSLCLTELFVFGAAPVLLAEELPHLRRSGMMTFFWLSVVVMISGGVSCVVNHTPMFAVIRGMAVACLLPSAIIVCHWMLRWNMDGFKWWLVGAALSTVLCTFVFQRTVEVAMLAGGVADEHASDAIISGPIYWIGRLNPLLNLPVKGWYLQCPTLYCIGAPLFMAGFSVLTSSSGRSAALSSMAFVLFVLVGGRRQRTMRRVGRWFWRLLIAAIVSVFVAKNAYAFAAINGWLGEESRKKYEKQTRGEKGLMRLLIGGRAAAFVGLLACYDKPIVGWGPWAMDTQGYYDEFLVKFGTEEDVLERQMLMDFAMKTGKTQDIGIIQCHSHITEFWCWFGVCGLVFILYVLFVVMRFLKQDCWVVPQWYAWLACSVPSFLWGLFFSPLTDRLGFVMFIVACLMARAVRKGYFVLPYNMQHEIVKFDLKR